VKKELSIENMNKQLIEVDAAPQSEVSLDLNNETNVSQH